MFNFLRTLAHLVLIDIIKIFFVRIHHQGTKVQKYKEKMYKCTNVKYHSPLRLEKKEVNSYKEEIRVKRNYSLLWYIN